MARKDRPDGSGWDPVELIGSPVDPKGDPEPDAGPAEPGEPEAGRTEVIGEANIGGRRTVVGVAATAVVGLMALVGALLVADRSAPERPPAPVVDRTPSGLVTTTPDVALPRLTTTMAPLTVPPTEPATTLAEGRYLLGRQTGLWLFFGGETPLQRLDLDNGELIDFGLRAEPSAVTGSAVVVHVRDAGLIGWLPADRPGQQSVWKRGYAAVGDEEGTLWILDPEAKPDGSDEEARGEAAGEADGEVADAGLDEEVTSVGQWALFDTSLGRVLERRPARLDPGVEDRRFSRLDLPGAMAAVRPGPATTPTAEGADTTATSGTDLLAILAPPYEVLANDQNWILTRSCELEPCSVQWFRRDLDPELPGVGDQGAGTDGVPRQRPTGGAVAARFVANGAWLLAAYPGGETELMEVEGTARFSFPAGANPAMSDDGRWLATRTDGQLTITDVESNETVHRRPLVTTDELSSEEANPAAGGLLFVAKNSVAAAG